MKPSPKAQAVGTYMLAPEHAPAIQVLAGHAAVAATTRIPHPYPADGAKNFIEQQARERAAGRAHVLVIKDGGTLVGVCGLHGIADGGAHELGYWVGRQYWGNGYASFGVKMILQFAFQNLGLNRVGAWALESNTASRRVLVKSGFRLLRVEPHGDPLLKRPDERLAAYELTRSGWLDFTNGALLAHLHPALRTILQEELIAGNEVAETGNGWPDAGSVFVKLRHRFCARSGALPPGVVYTEPDSPHWWFADYSAGSLRHIIAC